jgi:mRNA interferase RelE/StbE
MYELVVLNSAARELTKFDKPVRTRILGALDKIAENPYVGDLLKGDLSTIYSYHLKVSGVEYRIAYQIKEEEIIVIVMQIGTRENFYQELKKRFK